MKGALLGLLTTSLLIAAPACTEEAPSPPAGGPQSTSAIPDRRFEPPTVTRRPVLAWPPGRLYREALVFVRFVVSPQGEPTEVAVIEDRGFHDPAFANAAISSVKTMRFKPALLDGEPVASTYMMPVKYGLEEGGWRPGIGRVFRREVLKIDELFKKGDYEGADFHAQWMLKETVRSSYEFAVLNATLAQTHAGVGQNYKALRFAERATERTTEATKFALHQPVPRNQASDYLLPLDFIIPMLELRLRLATTSGMLKTAMQAYYELAGLVEMQPDDVRRLAAARITARLESNEPLVVQGRMEADRWFHEPYRRRFTLEKVNGNIDELYISCRGWRSELTYTPGNEWTLPVGGEDCVVSVVAEAGTTFSLIELTD